MQPTHANTPQQDNAYQFSFLTLKTHHPLPLASFKGKVMLIVNTASKCGFTPQYQGLETLYQHYTHQGLVVIGVPSNDFGQQEPGSEQEIKTFCNVHYGVTFPMTTKEVVSGPKAHPFYLWAKQKLGWMAAPKWNFHKYLIGRDGELITYFYSTTAPDSPKFTQAIEQALKHSPSDKAN